MKTKIILSILLLSSFCFASDVKDPWRIADGRKVLAQGPDWFYFFGKVIEVQPGGVRISGSYNNDGPGVFSGEFFVTNFPYLVADGDSIGLDEHLCARLAGIHTYTTVLMAPRTLHMLDYCAVWSTSAIPAPAPTADQIAAAKTAAIRKKAAASAAALKFNQTQAAAGNPFGQFRMGERYRDGDGVPKDLVQARAMFTAAARQGHSAASAALSQMYATARKETHSTH